MKTDCGTVDTRAASAGGNLAPFLDELDARESVALLALARKVFSSPRRYGFATGDEASEAFIRYKGRLRSIIRKGEAIEGNKDAYVDTCLRFLAKSVQRTLRRQELVEYVLESSGETCGCSPAEAEKNVRPAAEIGEGNRSFIGSIAPPFFLARMGAEKKRLLFLVVKCAWEVDDELAEKVASHLGVPVHWLSALLHQARATLEPARICLARLNERINAAWLRSRMIEAELLSDALGSERREKLSRSAVLCKNRYETLLGKKSKFRLLVSNRAIAEILRIPKGSVDSGLFYLKAGMSSGSANLSGGSCAAFAAGSAEAAGKP